MKWMAVLSMALVGCSGSAEDDDPSSLGGAGVLELDAYPALTREAKLTVTGKKAAGAGIIVDGDLTLIQDDETTFSLELTLTEGPNVIKLEPVTRSLSMGDAVRVTVELDSIPPGIREIDPIDGASGVTRLPTVRATFSEPLDCDAAAANTMEINVGATKVPGTMTCDDRVLTFTPNAMLSADTEHGVSVDSSLLDLAGNRLGLPHIWGFTTGP